MYWAANLLDCDTESGRNLPTTSSSNAKMGCGMSTEEKDGKQRNEEIEAQLRRDKVSQKNEIKMLLLGATKLLCLYTNCVES